MAMTGAAVDAGHDSGLRDPADMDVEALAEECARLNAAYRRGTPLVPDAIYDGVWLAALRERAPEHPFLQAPEAEPDDAFAGERVAHRAAMLSTAKAYDDDAISRFVAAIRKAAAEVGAPAPLVRVTAKLDGIAAYDYGDSLVTRGRNGYGTDVAYLLDRNVRVMGGERGRGAGEIVVDDAFFEAHLRNDEFGLKHPRNFIAGLAAGGSVKAHHEQALTAGAVHFVPYVTLEARHLSLEDFAANWREVMAVVQEASSYRCDGAVAEVISEDVRAVMGSTGSHHRWQIALKANTESAEAIVRDVRFTTGRTGRITPTLIIDPVELDGVTISHVTAHTSAHLERLGLGDGARVRIVRSGGVIPKTEEVLSRAPVAAALSACPSCGSAVEFEGAYAVCPETAICGAQASRALEHFFGTLGVCNGFGPTVCEKLAAAGKTRIDAIYGMTLVDFLSAGISAGVARNLMDELERSRREAVREEVFLGAFGVRHLGRGDSKRLLAAFSWDELGSLSAEQIAGVKGFGELTSGSIAREIASLWPMMQGVRSLGFTLVPVAGAAVASNSPIAGKKVVFTGTMTSGARKDMAKAAEALGAEVASSVTGATDLLVAGENVGATKLRAAEKHGVEVLSEAEYLSLIGGGA